MMQEEREAEMKDLVVSEKVQKISPKDLKETIKEEAEKEKLVIDPEESQETTEVVKEFPKVIREKIVTSQEILIAN